MTEQLSTRVYIGRICRVLGGYLEFKKVGGIDTRVIISKNVLVGEKKIPGVIGMKAIHLQSKGEREEVPKVKSLFIDIGAKDKQDADE